MLPPRPRPPGRRRADTRAGRGSRLRAAPAASVSAHATIPRSTRPRPSSEGVSAGIADHGRSAVVCAARGRASALTARASSGCASASPAAAPTWQGAKLGVCRMRPPGCNRRDAKRRGRRGRLRTWLSSLRRQHQSVQSRPQQPRPFERNLIATVTRPCERGRPQASPLHAERVQTVPEAERGVDSLALVVALDRCRAKPATSIARSRHGRRDRPHRRQWLGSPARVRCADLARLVQAHAGANRRACAQASDRSDQVRSARRTGSSRGRCGWRAGNLSTRACV